MSDDEPARDASDLTTVNLNPREMQALRDLLDAQIQIDEARMFPPKPTPAERDEDMHGVRHPIQDGDAVIFSIACQDAARAVRCDELPPACRWVADSAGGVSCTRCGHHEGPGMARCKVLRSMVDGTYEPRAQASLRVVL